MALLVRKLILMARLSVVSANLVSLIPLRLQFLLIFIEKKNVVLLSFIHELNPCSQTGRVPMATVKATLQHKTLTFTLYILTISLNNNSSEIP